MSRNLVEQRPRAKLHRILEKATELTDFKSLGLFAKQILTNPGATGAAFPSSRMLAERMAKFVPKNSKGLIIELGAGTGVVTQALLDRGLPAEQIVPVELSPEMHALLQKRFPELRIICGDAAKLKNLLHHHFGSNAGHVSAVVSSLPLRSLPKSVVQAIATQLDEVLAPNGRYIQFTYDLRPEVYAPLQRFNRAASQVIWYNLPPARVDVFKRCS